MNHGTIPSSWLTWIDRCDAGFLLKVQEQCIAEGVDQTNRAEVQRVANLQKYMGRFTFVERQEEA
jgi:hypothetical protein